MKNTLKTLLCSAVLLFVFSCSKNADVTPATNPDEVIVETGMNKTSSANMLGANPYVVLLESVTNNGDNTWTWVWSVQNPNPGNGNNGTAQGVSHWGFALGSCVNASNLVSAGYSENGTDWTEFAPSIGVDPSQQCFTQPVLKFDWGVSNNQKAYYRVVVNKDLPVNNNAVGVYKSGSRTGCGVFNFSGIGCGEIIVEIVE